MNELFNALDLQVSSLNDELVGRIHYQRSPSLIRQIQAEIKRLPLCTEFEVRLAVNILHYIAGAKAEGTTGLSEANLRQCVKNPSPRINGAPRSPADYNKLFASICNRNSVIKAFIL